jgi:hypothetical protein
MRTQLKVQLLSLIVVANGALALTLPKPSEACSGGQCSPNNECIPTSVVPSCSAMTCQQMYGECQIIGEGGCSACGGFCHDNWWPCGANHIFLTCSYSEVYAEHCFLYPEC